MWVLLTRRAGFNGRKCQPVAARDKGLTRRARGGPEKKPRSMPTDVEFRLKHT
jgi:hypothetical protein